MRFKCDYSDSIDETFKMIMPIANKKDELIHHMYIGLNKSKNFTKNIIFNRVLDKTKFLECCLFFFWPNF